MPAVLLLLAACAGPPAAAFSPALPPVSPAEEASALAAFNASASQFRRETEQRLQALGTRLGEAMGLDRAATVHLLSANEVNAYARGGTVYVTLGMVRFVRNDDELALVVGHELGHLVADRDPGVARSAPEHRERLADAHALVGLYRAGYDIRVACDVWRRMATELAWRDVPSTPSHPSFAERFVRAHKLAESLLGGSPIPKPPALQFDGPAVPTSPALPVTHR